MMGKQERRLSERSQKRIMKEIPLGNGLNAKVDAKIQNSAEKQIIRLP